MRRGCPFIWLLMIGISCESILRTEEQAQEYFSLAMDTMSFSAENGQRFDSINALRMKAADSLFGMALEFDSLFVEAYYWQAMTRTKLKDYDGALRILSSGVSYGELYDRDVKMLLMSRGVLLMKLGNEKAAASDFRKSLKLYNKFLMSFDSTDGGVVGAVSNMVLLHSYLNERGEAYDLIQRHQNDDPFYEDLKNQIDSIDIEKVIQRF